MCVRGVGCLDHSFALCLPLTAKDNWAFQTSALEMKNEGVEMSFVTADVSSLKC